MHVECERACDVPSTNSALSCVSAEPLEHTRRPWWLPERHLGHFFHWRHLERTKRWLGEFALSLSTMDKSSINSNTLEPRAWSLVLDMVALVCPKDGLLSPAGCHNFTLVACKQNRFSAIGMAASSPQRRNKCSWIFGRKRTPQTRRERRKPAAARLGITSGKNNQGLVCVLGCQCPATPPESRDHLHQRTDGRCRTSVGA